MSSTSRRSKESKEEETSQYSDAALARRSAKPVKGSSTFWSARQTTCARKEKRLTEVAKKLEHVHFSKTLKLNVGGQLFSTSLETMKRDSGTYVFELTIKSRFINYRTNLAHMHDFQPGSMLHAMFSGRFDTKPAEDGCHFIDRDDTHILYILSYLRTGQFVVPEDKVVRMELLPEAEFYRVEGMLVELTQPFRESTLLSSDQRQILTRWLRDKHDSLSNILEYSLLYRASRNGWAASNFHSVVAITRVQQWQWSGVRKAMCLEATPSNLGNVSFLQLS